MRRPGVLLVLVLLFPAARGFADADASVAGPRAVSRSSLASMRRFEAAASIGYGAPAAWAERGARLRDTTFGTVPIGIEGSYRFTKLLGVSTAAHYALSIPKLCASAEDCKKSVGREVTLAVRARFFLPPLGALEAFADAGIGYEWFATKLSDSGATSTRSYRGPLFFAAQIAAPFRLRSRWTLGPAFTTSVGTFSHYALDTNVRTAQGRVPARAVHAWFALTVRLGFQF